MLAAIDARDEEIGAYLYLDRALALREAESADAARARNESGPLTGLPISIKDVLGVRGQPCTPFHRCFEVSSGLLTAAQLNVS